MEELVELVAEGAARRTVVGRAGSVVAARSEEDAH